MSDPDIEIQLPDGLIECDASDGVSLWCDGLRIIDDTDEARRYLEHFGISQCTCHCECDEGVHYDDNHSCPVNNPEGVCFVCATEEEE